ncbi:MAG: hypothetical protein Q4B58_09095, partial [Bacteroidales bacterium]|nr:hypothetical protein [Bacteroidales bacterium]
PGCKEKYEAADVWKEFGTIVEDATTSIDDIHAMDKASGKAAKRLENGRLILEKDGVMYNAAGFGL